MNQVDSFTRIAVQSSVPAYTSTRTLADRTNATIDQPLKRGKTCPMLELEDALLQLFNVNQNLSIRSFCELNSYDDAMRHRLSRFLARPDMVRLKAIHQAWDGDTAEALHSEANQIIANHFRCVSHVAAVSGFICVLLRSPLPLFPLHLLADCNVHRALYYSPRRPCSHHKCHLNQQHHKFRTVVYYAKLFVLLHLITIVKKEWPVWNWHGKSQQIQQQQ